VFDREAALVSQRGAVERCKTKGSAPCGLPFISITPPVPLSKEVIRRVGYERSTRQAGGTSRLGAVPELGASEIAPSVGEPCRMRAERLARDLVRVSCFNEAFSETL
jgi:hypothetical protein